MQKTNIKGSILIWAIFLSLIIGVTFISINTKIHKNLKNYNTFSNEINEQNEIINIINSGSTDSLFKSKYLENGNKILFPSKTIIGFGLKKSENYITKIISDSKITIYIKNGGPIKYENGTLSGVIINSDVIDMTTGDLKIKNLGGYSKLLIKSDTPNNLIQQKINYKILKKVGNKEIIKTKGLIKNF